MNNKLAICMKCEMMQILPFLGPQCVLCGCLLRLKTLTPGQKCPLGLW